MNDDAQQSYNTLGSSI